MKRQRIGLILGAVAWLVAGCSQEQTTDDAIYSHVLIEPRSSVAEGEVTPLSEGATRAAVDASQSLTFYFLRANETGAGTGIYRPYNTAVLPATRTAGAGAQPLTFTPSIAYLASGANSKLTGWHPQATNVTDGVASWTLDGTQDVLTATAQAGNYTTALPTLEFQHRLSQLNFRLQSADARAQGVWGRITAIRVLNQPTACRYTPATDDATGNVTVDASPIATFEVKNLPTTLVPLTVTAIGDPVMIAPQPSAAVLTVVVEGATGRMAKVKIPAATYLSGKAYAIDLRLEEDDIFGNASLASWTVVDRIEQSVIPKINLSEKGTANCYVVTRTNKQGYYFDATKRGNNATGMAGINYGTLPVLSTATEARVIWQTGTGATTGLVVDPATLKLEDGKVLFNTGTATEGNAVIGLFAASAATAPCLWSWHIWRVNGPLPADVACVKTPSPTSAPANFKMMALNLGAFNNTSNDVGSIGLLYQWGRKDPFPGPKDFTKTEPTNIYGSYNKNGTVGSWNGAYSVQALATSSTIGKEAWAVQYPGVLITNSTDPYDWMVTKNDYLWGTPWVAGGVNSYNGSQGTKSIYDPCPVGYRVPPQDTWNAQTAKGSFANNGMTLEKIAAGFWFPAVGFRDGSNVGVFANSPGYGFYWSSSIHSSGSANGGSLYFDGGSLNPQNSNFRVHGFSVRCVAE